MHTGDSSLRMCDFLLIFLSSFAFAAYRIEKLDSDKNVGQELNGCKYFILTLMTSRFLTEWTFSRHSSLKINCSYMFNLF